MRLRLGLLLVLVARVASASPTLSLDDPVYERLAVLRAQGRIPLYLDGIRPLTEYDAQRLLLKAGEAPDERLISPYERGLWFDVAHRVTARLGLFSDETRPYDTKALTVQMAGGIAVSCEHQEGRPCDQGGGGVLELDSAAGFGPWISLVTRLQLIAGSNQWDLHGNLDRVYLNGQWGPVALLLGRDVLVLGPGVHTQLIWGDNSAALDHVRIQTAHPIKIPRIPVTVSALYAVGQLRDPQTYPGTMVTLTRIELAFADQFELGAMQLLQLNGGPIHYGFPEFFGEHFTRTGNYAGVGGSNRRDSFDFTYTNRWARGLRLYYELAFEDFRKKVVDMFLYDCDHLMGIEMPALTLSGKHGFVVELQHNGPFSQQHPYFATGLTNAGRAVGAPLGPNSWSLYASARIDLPRRTTVYPWFEWAQPSSDYYDQIDYGPILLRKTGYQERRYRIGARARFWLRYGFRIEPRVLYEHIDTYAFVPGATRNNGGAAVDIFWSKPAR